MTTAIPADGPLIIHDDQAFFSRDRLGIEPLLYAPCKDAVVVGKTYKDIYATGLVPRVWREEALLDFLSVGSVVFPEGATFFQGIFEVPPGCDLHVSRSDATVTIRETIPEPSDELGEESLPLLGEQLMKSLGDSLEGAGLCLSGGLDSSSVAAAWARRGEPHCFIYGVSGSSDRELALETAQALGVKPVLIDPQPDTSIEELRVMLRCLEIPVHIPGGPLPQFRLLSAMAESGVKTVLSGQGGDEVFSGYPWHFPLAMSTLAERDPETATRLTALHEKHPPFGPLDLRLSRRNFTRTTSWVNLNDGGACAALGLSREEVAHRSGVGFFAADLPDWTSLRRHSLTGRSLRFLLHYDHRLARHFGLQGGAPFLDDGVVDLVSRFRLDFLYGEGMLKYPLRRLFLEVPEKVRFHTKKTGFWHNSPGLPNLRPEVERLLGTTPLGEMIARPDMLSKMTPAALWRFFSLGTLLEVNN